MKTSFTTSFLQHTRLAAVTAGLLVASLTADAMARPTSGFRKAGKQAQAKTRLAEQPQSRLLNLASLPGNSQNYVTDGMGGWTHYSNSTYSYNSAGKLVQKIDVIPVLNQNLYKETNTYDALGNQTEAFNYEWVNNAWQMANNSYKTNYTYGAGSNITEQIDQTYNTGTLAFENTYRETTSYNGSGNMTEKTYYDWDASATTWVPTEREQYTYTGNQISEIVIQEYDMGNFVNSMRYTNIVWHNAATFQISSVLGHTWTGTAWAQSERSNVTYDSFGGSVTLWEEFDNGNWIPAFRMTESFDNHSNYTGFKFEYWDGASAWITGSEEQEILTYNSNFDITQRIFRDTFNINNTLEDYRKETYTNFVTGVSAAAYELPVTVFPNPATDRLSISSSVAGPAQVVVTDLTGRTILSQTMAITNSELSLANLTSGTYLLHISTASGSKIAKIVKQ